MKQTEYEIDINIIVADEDFEKFSNELESLLGRYSKGTFPGVFNIFYDYEGKES